MKYAISNLVFLLKKGKNTVFNSLRCLFFPNSSLVLAWWKYDAGTNWGDALNPILVRYMAGKNIIPYNEIFLYKNLNIYSVIGSVLGTFNKNNLVIWGSGFISAESKIKIKPKKVCAVRGPLTRNLLLKQGISCPEIYGDPALLFPLFYKPSIKKHYKLGIIPHYVDQENPMLQNLIDDPDVLYIDILSGIYKVVDDICKCEQIASSSLHGIIAADSYGIPSIWIKFSDDIVGDGFKFYDYFESVGRKKEKPLAIKDGMTSDDILNCVLDYDISIDLVQLIEACPFMTENQINSLKKNMDVIGPKYH